MLKNAILLGTIVALLNMAETPATETRAVDGDTIVYEGARIRLACIDSPESGQSGYSFSKEVLESLLQNVPLSIITNTDKDSYGRTVAVILDSNGHSLNELMLKAGAAMLTPQHKKSCEKYFETLESAEQEAKQLQLGIWSPPAFPPIPPSLYRKLKPFLR